MDRRVDRSGWLTADDIPKKAELGRQYVKMMLSNGPSNQGFHPILFTMTGISRIGLSNQADPVPNSGVQKVSGLLEATQVYNRALTIRTGNCTEHAAVAFVYLHRLGVKPLVMLGYDNGMSANHMFLAVGLDQTQPNFTMMTGNKATDDKIRAVDKSWICDPWRNVTYRATEKFWATETNATNGLQVQAYSI